MIWHLITGEYPPKSGGVSDYTRCVALALVSKGEEVHVWAAPCVGPEAADPGITVHRLPDHFGLSGLRWLRRQLRRCSEPAQVVVQYVPHMYGCKGMNVAFALWIWGFCPKEPWVMFHEVRHSTTWKQPVKHLVLGLMQSLMAGLVDRGAKRRFVSTPAWEPLLTRRRSCPVTWLPVPSNVPLEVDPAQMDRLRRELGLAEGASVIGHFGTFGQAICAALNETLPALVRADGRRKVLLVGMNGQEFRKRLVDANPDLVGNVVATGPVPAEAVAAHLKACDLLVQPFADGVTGRRTSLMAGLALGLPIVTTDGFLTEPLWRTEKMTALVPAGDSAAFVQMVERYLKDAAARAELGRRALQGYAEFFSVDFTVSKLIEAARLKDPGRRSIGSRGK